MQNEPSRDEIPGAPPGMLNDWRQLIRNDQFFLLASEAAFDAFLIHEKGKILFVNKTLENLLGYDRSELLGRSVLEIVGAESRNELIRRMQTGSSEPYEIEGVRRNGERFYAEIRAKNILVDGRTLRLAAIRDVTAHRKKELDLSEDLEAYQRGQSLLLELLKQIGHPYDELLQRVTEASARTLEVKRVGVWMFENGDFRSISLRDMFDMRDNVHRDSQELRAEDYPAYFASLRTQRVLAAEDALNDPRTCGLAEPYLIPNGIGAMLDVPIWRRGRIAGILCHEHVGGPRTWRPVEQQIASSMADIISIALEDRDRRRAEEDVRKREEHLRLLTTQLPALLWTTDRRLRVTSVVGSGLSPLNVSPQERRPFLFEILQKGEPTHTLIKPQMEALEGKSVAYDDEWQGHFYQVRIEPFRNDGGEVIGTIGLALDITERKRAEDEVRLLHGVTLAMSGAEDTDGALEAALVTICREVNWEVGLVWVPDRKTSRLTVSEARYLADPRHEPYWEASRAVTFEMGEGKLGRAWQTRKPVWTRDGTIDQLYKRSEGLRRAGLLSALAVPVLDGNEVLAVLDFAMAGRRLEDERMVRFVTGAAAQLGPILRRKEIEAERLLLLEEQRKLAEEARSREAELRSIINHIVDAVFVNDTEGRITLMNETARQLIQSVGMEPRLGIQMAELSQALRISRMGVPLRAEEDPFVRVLHGETLVDEEIEVRLQRPARTAFLRVSAGPIRDVAGRIIGGVGVGRDITEFVEFSRMKDSFIRVTAHELKTPLAIMKGYSQAVLRAKEEFPPTYRKMLEAIDSGATRIVRLVNDLLDVSRKGAIAINLDAAETFDLADCVHDLLRSQTLSSDHTIQFHSVEHAIVRADRGRIEQVVTNLLQNASKYSPAGSEVGISIVRSDGEVTVSVADRGIGIPQEKQPCIFQRFFRAHADTPYDAGGMGVGLYISKEIIARHGGRMWFTSREGKGSTFSFSLPVAEA